MNSTVLVAPSILAADFRRLGDEIQRAEAAGADWIHLDVMDGHFVDNISFGPAVVAAAREQTRLPLDVHLMIERADHYVPRFAKAGASSITIHVEPETHHDVATTLQQIRDLGCKTGLALNPATPFAAVEPHLSAIDLLLVMTVHPGFGGQPFQVDTIAKVQSARRWREAEKAEFHIEVDGGINAETAQLAVAGGANVLVAGTSIFRSSDYAGAIRALRGDRAS